MKTFSNDLLRDTINAMPDDDRYRLLATFRTNERVDDFQSALRWFLCRLIVSRAYTKRYHKPYLVKREWYEDKPSVHRYDTLSYSTEVDRILVLIDHIKTYRKPTKPMGDLDREASAVRIALHAYYLRMVEYDITMLLENRGISFHVNKRKDRYVKSPYRAITECDRYLRSNRWDIQDALEAWVKDENDAHTQWLENPKQHKLPPKPPTPARIVHMYSRLLRHLTVVSVSSAIPIDSLSDPENGDDWQDWIEADHALPYIKDVQIRIKQLRHAARFANQRFHGVDNRMNENYRYDPPRNEP